MSKPKRKQPPPHLYPGKGEGKDEADDDETEDVYNDEQREKMLDDDEITAAEEGFMKGRENEAPSKKKTRKNTVSHTDTTSVELAKEDAEED
jgi:hypothetical protein